MAIIITTNDKGQAVGLKGVLPNGEIGVIYDMARPFTEEELNDPDKFNEHLKDLNKRIGEQYPALANAGSGK